MARLAVVIVSWNVCDLLRRCLRTLDTALLRIDADTDTEVIVVDNASSDGTPAMLRSEFPAVRLLESGHNAGFAAGNNLALRWLLPRLSDTDTDVLLLNPDTEPQPDSLARMLAALRESPDLAAVGPQLRHADGRAQSSRRRFPTLPMLLCESTLVERLLPRNLWLRRYRCAERGDDVAQRCDWLVGAALLVRGSAIARAGLLDEGYFLYSEELEWQYRIQATWRAPGLRLEPTGYRYRALPDARAIAYLPDAVVLHHEGKSSEQVLPARHLHFQRSKLRLARGWLGLRAAALLWLVLWAGYAWELLVESAKWAVGHRRALRRARIAAYRAVLRGLLE